MAEGTNESRCCFSRFLTKVFSFSVTRPSDILSWRVFLELCQGPFSSGFVDERFFLQEAMCRCCWSCEGSPLRNDRWRVFLRWRMLIRPPLPGVEKECSSTLQTLDEWIRPRLRCVCYNNGGSHGLDAQLSSARDTWRPCEPYKRVPEGVLAAGEHSPGE